MVFGVFRIGCTVVVYPYLCIFYVDKPPPKKGGSINVIVCCNGVNRFCIGVCILYKCTDTYLLVAEKRIDENPIFFYIFLFVFTKRSNRFCVWGRECHPLFARLNPFKKKEEWLPANPFIIGSSSNSSSTDSDTINSFY